MITRLQHLALVVSLAAFFACLGLNAPLSEALVIGGDDMYELCKAQTLHRKPELAAQMWNDQPWLHTLFVARAFALLGENAAIPRLFTIACMFALVVACWHIMGKESATLERVFFVCVFFTSTEIPSLTTSAMLEPPAMALAVLAVSCSCSESKSLSRWRAYLAGILIAAASFVKLTALIILPAWLVLLWLQRKSTALTNSIARLALGFVFGTLFVTGISPTLSFESLWLSHWRAHEIAAGFEYGFQVEEVFNDWTILIAVLLGLVPLATPRSSVRGGTLFALTWLLTDVVVHVWHKPWFGYYSIHFHIPLAILAAQGAGWVTRRAWDGLQPERSGDLHDDKESETASAAFPKNMSHSLAAVLAAIVTSCWFGIRLPFFFNDLARIHSQETAAHNPFVPVIRQYADQARWIYSNDNTVVFHGGVLQPPELVVISYKRVTTGDIDKDKIFAIARAYKPELLLLRRDGELAEERFRKWLANDKYRRVMWSGNTELWVSAELQPSEARSPEALVKHLRL